MSDMKSAQETKEESKSASDEIPMTFPQRVSDTDTTTRIYDFLVTWTDVTGLRCGEVPRKDCFIIIDQSIF